VFYNDYDDLRTLDPSFDPGPPPSVRFPFDNNMSGETYGVELASQWQVRNGWRLNASYSWLDMKLRHIKKHRRCQPVQQGGHLVCL